MKKKAVDKSLGFTNISAPVVKVGKKTGGSGKSVTVKKPKK